MTWEAFVADFLHFRRERAAAATTLAHYRQDLQGFARWCTAQKGAAPDLDGVTAMELAAFRTWLDERYKPSTANGRLSTLRTAFGWATGQGLLERSPARHLRLVPEVLLGPQAPDRQQLSA